MELSEPARRRFAARVRHRASMTRQQTRRAMPELRTLIKFALVGGSGYAVNIVVFALVEQLGTRHVVAATIAFLAAVMNNFHWNRLWTFAAGTPDGEQRSLRVSGVSFVMSLAGIVTASLRFLASARGPRRAVGAAAGALDRQAQRLLVRADVSPEVQRHAQRFLLVSTASFLFSLGVMEALVNLGVHAIVAQAISIGVAMPFAFVANRVWTFAEPGALRRAVRGA